MKKSISVLFLALLLFAFTACDESVEEYKKSNENQVKKEYGEFYTEDGVLQNTKITLVIENEMLIAPVNELSYAVYDQCDFFVDIVSHRNDEETIEIFQDGVWQEVSNCGDEREIEPAWGPLVTSYRAHHVWHRSMSFVPTDEEDYTGSLSYRSLNAGQYRLRVKYNALARDENVEIPEEQLEAVAYFTVTAPVE